MWKIISLVFFVLSLPFIILASVVGLALFVPAPECANPPSSNLANSTQLLDSKTKQLDKTGSTSISQEELTSVLQTQFGQNVQDLRVCFQNGSINISGKVKNKISPSFYLSTQLDTNNKVLALTNTKVTVGGLGFAKNLVGGFAQARLNDSLTKNPMFENYTMAIQDNSLQIKLNPQKMNK